MAYNPAPEVTVYNEVGKNLSSYIKEVEKIEKEKNKTSLKPQPVVRREITSDGKQIDRVVSKTENQSEKTTVSENTSGTRVLSRTVNSEKADANEEISNTNSTARTPIPVVRKVYNEQENSSTTQKQEIREIEQEEKEIPKKSVRRIKERHQNQDDTEATQK